MTEQDLKGKTIVITGATAGIGRATAEALAARGARVVGISRDPEKCARVASEIRATTGNRHMSFLVADLARMQEVRQVCEDLLNQLPRIDVLVNNVGAIFYRRGETAESFERTFALNHLSGFLTTLLLARRLIASAPARIVNVSSSAQFSGKMHFDDLQFEKRYFSFRAYGQSKLANMLFTYELARRLEGTGVTVNAMHPGLVQTDIGTAGNALVRIVQKWILRSQRTPEEGARTVVYLAASPEAAGVHGKFFIDEQETRSARASYDTAAAARLWKMSAAMVAPYLDPLLARPLLD